jgi:hypothetical protein
MANKLLLRSGLQSGLTIRSGINSGRTICYQELNGIWYPISDSTYSLAGLPPMPPPATPGIQWLTCQSCQGYRASDRVLNDATCEVCRM